MKADKLTKILASFFGAGYSPILPGTTGTLFAIPAYYGLTLLGPIPYIAITAALVLIAIPIADRAEKIFGKKDARQIVIDEVAGYLVTMLFFWKFDPIAAAIGFLAFRFFDIVKVPPANMIERIGGGAGVVLDDIAAGAHACIATHIIMLLI